MDSSAPGVSPSDRIRRVRPDGTEFWSARDLMPLMGYSRWENFEETDQPDDEDRQDQGLDVDKLFLRSQEKTGGRPRDDYELSRYAAYLVACAERRAPTFPNAPPRLPLLRCQDAGG